MKDFNLLANGFDRFFDEVLQAPMWQNSRSFTPPCDIQETESHFLISLDVPGVNRDDIKIEVLDGKLNVSGRRSLNRQNGEKSTWSFAERVEGEFSRSFQLGRQVDAEKIEASHKDGVLHVSVAKAEKAKARLIKIVS